MSTLLQVFLIFISIASATKFPPQGKPGLSKCCLKGHLHNGTPKGSLTNYSSTEFYVVHPPSGPTKKAILFLTDVMGHRLINSQLLADSISHSGRYTVVMPDLFNGDAWNINKVPEPEELERWLAKHQVTQKAILETSLKFLRKKFKVKKIGATGYCWGGKYVVQLLSGEVDVGVIAHTSLTTLEEFGAIKGPLQIASAEVDELFTPQARQEAEAVLAAGNKTYESTLYGGVAHGFAARGNLENPIERRALYRALDNLLYWFETYL